MNGISVTFVKFQGHICPPLLTLHKKKNYKRNHHIPRSMVLTISEREGEDSGNTEAYGAIANCYTELRDLEKAEKFY